MLARFSLYSALKNQKFYDQFFILALVEKGLSFTEIGWLVALREATIVVMEVPSGAIADVTGRRRVLLLAVAAYMASFACLGFGHSLGSIAAGMALIGFGDSFRSGAHKAMIYRWLQIQDRTDQRTRTYSITRSWGKIGSAGCVLIASAIVWATSSYASTFAWTLVPYVFLFLLLASYPRQLESSSARDGSARSPGAVGSHLRKSIAMVARAGGARRLVLESALFEGVARASRDYLQPLLAVTAATGAVAYLQGSQTIPSADGRISITIGATYFVLFLLAAAATRLSSPLAGRLGERRASGLFWIALAPVAAAVLSGDMLRVAAIGAVGLVVLHALFDAWRPIMLGRLDEHVPEEMGAAVLSVESLVRRLATAAVAPVLGWSIDRLSGEELRLWPISIALGAACLLAIPIRGRATTPDVNDPASD